MIPITIKRILLTLCFVGLVWTPTFIYAHHTSETHPSVVLAAATAHAQPAPHPTTIAPSKDAPAALTAAPTDKPPPTARELMGSATKVINDWRAIGWLAGIIALLNLMMNLLRFGPIAEWFKVHKKKWLKPYLAAGFGAAFGGFSTYQTTADTLQSVVAGLMAGLAAVGMHETVKRRKIKKRTS